MLALLVALVSLFFAAAPVAILVPARTIVVLGTVLDSAKSKPLAATWVVAPEAEVATKTDENGAFTLGVPVQDSVKRLRLVARRLGYLPGALIAPIKGDTLIVEFRLRISTVRLQAVVPTVAERAARTPSQP